MKHHSFPLFPKRKTSNSISNLNSLSTALSLNIDILLEAKKLPLEKRYKDFEIPKDDSSMRRVYDPTPKIRQIQSRINKRIFCELIDWPEYLYGSLPNDLNPKNPISRDYIACAYQHCEAKSLLKIDISNFFDNIHKDFVYEIFSDLFKFPHEVSEYLTDICCYGDFLVQGALTSSYIATLCFWNNEGEVVKKLKRKQLVYTRLVDDITVSSKISNFNFQYAEHHIKTMLIEKDLPINESKKKTLRIGIDPLEVHGLRVNYASPRLPADEVKRIRASVHNVVKMSKINNYRTSLAYRKMHDRCMGRVNKLARVGHSKHAEFKNKLVKILPLPSIRDIGKVERALLVLEKLNKEDFSNKKYIRKFYIAQYRTSIINRTYVKKAIVLKNRLNKIKSNQILGNF